MHVIDIDYLLAVAEGGSISRAAERLGISQPALTKAIRRIESDVGLRLFERTAKGVAPTEAGQAFIRRAARISLEYEDAMQELQQMRTGELGVLRLGLSPTVNERLMLDACRKLMRERPAARFKLRERLSGELLPMLRAGEFDIVLAPLPNGETIDLAFVPLYEDRLHIVATHDHPLRQHADLSLHHLVDAEWMVPPPDTRVRRHIDEMFGRNGLEGPRIRIETDFGGLATYQMMEGTQLLSICGDETRAKLKPLGIEPMPVAGASFGRRIGVMYRPQAHLSPLAQRVIELLRQSVPSGKGRAGMRRAA